MGIIMHDDIAYSGASGGAEIDDTTTSSSKVWSSQKTSTEIANNAYTLPTASANTLGGIKVGAGLSINNGILNTKGSLVRYTMTTRSTISVMGYVGQMYNLHLRDTASGSTLLTDINNKKIIPLAICIYEYGIQGGFICAQTSDSQPYYVSGDDLCISGFIITNSDVAHEYNSGTTVYLTCLMLD